MTEGGDLPHELDEETALRLLVKEILDTDPSKLKIKAVSDEEFEKALSLFRDAEAEFRSRDEHAAADLAARKIASWETARQMPDDLLEFLRKPDTPDH